MPSPSAAGAESLTDAARLARFNETRFNEMLAWGVREGVEHAITRLKGWPLPRHPPPNVPAPPLPKDYLKMQPVPEDGESGEDAGER